MYVCTSGSCHALESLRTFCDHVHVLSQRDCSEIRELCVEVSVRCSAALAMSHMLREDASWCRLDAPVAGSHSLEVPVPALHFDDTCLIPVLNTPASHHESSGSGRPAWRCRRGLDGSRGSMQARAGHLV